jgi:hypothetical protein
VQTRLGRTSFLTLQDGNTSLVVQTVTTKIECMLNQTKKPMHKLLIWIRKKQHQMARSGSNQDGTIVRIKIIFFTKE